MLKVFLLCVNSTQATNAVGPQRRDSEVALCLHVAMMLCGGSMCLHLLSGRAS